MEIKRYEGTGRMSRAVVYGDTVYLCGQTSRDQADMAGQTKAVLAKIEELLGKYGSDKDHILSATIYVGQQRLRARSLLRRSPHGFRRHFGGNLHCGRPRRRDGRVTESGAPIFPTRILQSHFELGECGKLTLRPAGAKPKENFD